MLKKKNCVLTLMVITYVILFVIRRSAEAHWWKSSDFYTYAYTYTNKELVKTYLYEIAVAFVIAVLPYEKFFSGLRDTIFLFTSDKANKSKVYSIILSIGYVIITFTILGIYNWMLEYTVRPITIAFLILLLWITISVCLFQFMNEVLNIVIQIILSIANFFIMNFVIEDFQFTATTFFTSIVFLICYAVIVKFKKDGLIYAGTLMFISFGIFIFFSIKKKIIFYDMSNNESLHNTVYMIKKEIGNPILVFFIVLFLVFLTLILVMSGRICEYSKKRCGILLGLSLFLVVFFLGGFESSHTQYEFIILAIIIRISIIRHGKKFKDDEETDEDEIIQFILEREKLHETEKVRLKETISNLENEVIYLKGKAVSENEKKEFSE